MSVRDRTNEFFSSLDHTLASVKSSDPILSSSPHQQALSPRRRSSVNSLHSPTQQHSEFTRKALAANRQLQSTIGKLERLAKLVRSAYDDRPGEIDEITHVVRQDMAVLKQQISELESLRGGQGEHPQQVVLFLQKGLMDLSANFGKTLDSRQQSLKAQRERREQYGTAPVVNVVSQRSIVRNASDHVALEMPSSGGGKSAGGYQQLAMMEGEDTSYISSRHQAVEGLESMINELGAVYQQLAHLVSAQGELVQRIDFNIEDVQVNVQRGQEQLMRYLRSIQNNRWLMIKIFGVLIVFMILFILFLA